MPDVLTAPSKILSIQSHVAYGYVGNRASVFPLQCMGFDVLAVNTVQFSNHTGYQKWRGDIFSKEHINSVLEGIREMGIFPEIKAVVSGYLGDAGLGELVVEKVAEIKAASPNAVYICDPVMGDVGRGIFVKPSLPPFFTNNAVKVADIITPNQFELALLTGIDIHTRDDTKAACQILHDKGVQTVLVTSLITQDTHDDEISMFASSKKGEAYLVTTPKLKFSDDPNGSGDLTAALFTGNLMRNPSLKEALEATADCVFKVFQNTVNAGTRELALIQSRSDFLNTSHPEMKAQKI